MYHEDKCPSGHPISSQAEADFVALLAAEYERGYLAAKTHDRCHLWNARGAKCAWHSEHMCGLTPCSDMRSVGNPYKTKGDALCEDIEAE